MLFFLQKSAVLLHIVVSCAFILLDTVCLNGCFWLELCIWWECGNVGDTESVSFSPFCCVIDGRQKGDSSGSNMVE